MLRFLRICAATGLVLGCLALVAALWQRSVAGTALEAAAAQGDISAESALYLWTGLVPGAGTLMFACACDIGLASLSTPENPRQRALLCGLVLKGLCSVALALTAPIIAPIGVFLMHMPLMATWLSARKIGDSSPSFARIIGKASLMSIVWMIVWPLVSLLLAFFGIYILLGM